MAMSTKRYDSEVKSKFTCVVQRGGDGCSRWFCAKLGHTTVSFHGERVVEMWIQVINNDCGFLQVCRTWLETDLFTTSDAWGSIAVLAQHTVGEVPAPPSHQRWAPGQLQPAFYWQGGGGQVTRGTWWSLGRKWMTKLAWSSKLALMNMNVFTGRWQWVGLLPEQGDVGGSDGAWKKPSSHSHLVAPAEEGFVLSGQTWHNSLDTDGLK